MVGARPGLLALCAAALGCAPEPAAHTALVLVSDTNIDAVESIEFEIRASGRLEATRSPLPADGSPLFLTLLRDQGPLGPLQVRARGFAGETVLIERAAEISFVPGSTRVVPLFLLQACLEARCEADQTCTEQGCRSPVLGPESLPPWTGQPPSLDDPLSADAGMLDADARDGGESADDGSTTGSDASVKLEACQGNMLTDVMSDPNHCGSCGNACRPVPAIYHAQPVCESGGCGYDCEPLWDDCDDSILNGCEQNLTVNQHCGGCDQACDPSQQCSAAGICEPT